MSKPTVMIGFLGTTLDAGKGYKRWQKWRPTVAVCQHEDLMVDRYELIHDRRHTALAERVRDDIMLASPETEVMLHDATVDDPWDFEEVFAVLHDFAKGYEFQPDREDYLINITTGTHVAQICMFLLTESHHFPARIIQTSPGRGADQVGTYRIIDLDLSRYDRLASRFAAERIEGTSFLKSGIETKSAAFNHMIDEIEQVTIRTRAPVLLMGPTGAGKSHLAARIYALKKNRHQVDGPFVEVNCATLRGDSAMSALFGHKKGAFTGAAADRAGLLKSADGGVLFLDEIGELGLDEQAMILRAIEEKRFLPVGSDREVASDFQLIAGTNRDLAEAVADGTFREDLFARLNLWTFHLPGLKDRHEDIEPNLEYELARFAREAGDRITFNREARTAFLKFAHSAAAPWSANFRDLSAAVTRMATFARGGRIGVDEVTAEIARLKRTWRVGSAGTNGDARLTAILGDRLDDIDLFDRAQLATVIEVCQKAKSMSEAGRQLFAASRLRKKQANDSDRLRKYLAKFDLSWDKVKSD
ncbi:RNA repair transcriptional activator RtcR [Kordiimonas aestuarii]|uniref:RNA repair transcriptional activator RtcR n=1 Tax=Kordiimonas aestuarii TaxID=1005925 RepID=UPI0021D28772|nr:RNA repair transcriptional activator RtcR [Kordiimonas aestuarii]